MFATTELLEQILLSVDDIKSLMLTRRVAPQWRAVIDDTSSLKKKMWLAPRQLDREWYLSPGAINVHKRPRITCAAAATSAADSGDVIYKSGNFNPFLLHINPRDTSGSIWKSEFHLSWIPQPLFVRKQAKASYHKPRSMFLKMFAMQPPVPVVYLRVRNSGNELRNYRWLVERVKNKKEVRVGDVLRALSHMPKGEDAMLMVEERGDDVSSGAAGGD